MPCTCSQPTSSWSDPPNCSLALKPVHNLLLLRTQKHWRETDYLKRLTQTFTTEPVNKITKLGEEMFMTSPNQWDAVFFWYNVSWEVTVTPGRESDWFQGQGSFLQYSRTTAATETGCGMDEEMWRVWESAPQWEEAGLAQWQSSLDSWLSSALLQSVSGWLRLFVFVSVRIWFRRFGRVRLAAAVLVWFVFFVVHLVVVIVFIIIILIILWKQNNQNGYSWYFVYSILLSNGRVCSHHPRLHHHRPPRWMSRHQRKPSDHRRRRHHPHPPLPQCPIRKQIFRRGRQHVNTKTSLTTLERNKRNFQDSQIS